jgi:hypothetical protein
MLQTPISRHNRVQNSKFHSTGLVPLQSDYDDPQALYYSPLVQAPAQETTSGAVVCCIVFLGPLPTLLALLPLLPLVVISSSSPSLHICRAPPASSLTIVAPESTCHFLFSTRSTKLLKCKYLILYVSYHLKCLATDSKSVPTCIPVISEIIFHSSLATQHSKNKCHCLRFITE